MVKEIPLSQGKVTLVDDQDFERLNKVKWCATKGTNTYYVMRHQYLGCFNGKKKFKTEMIHRVIMNPTKDMMIDHINGDGLDNRKSNLRIVTHRQNLQNMTHANKSTKYTGVHWVKRESHWAARITINGKRKYLGSFHDPLSAAIIYEFVLREVIGEELICKMNIN